VRRDALLAVGLLIAGWLATLWLPPWSNEQVNDLYVYRTFAEPVLAGALPYRDVFFEYPPLAAPAIALPGVLGTGEDVFRLAFAGWTLLLAAAVVVLCGVLAARSGGERRIALLAAATMPLLCGALLRTHFDLAPVALTLAALTLLCAERPRAGLAVLGLGVMTKGFPLVAAPVALAWLAGRGQVRAAWQGAVVMAIVVVLIGAAAVAASPDGALDAARYHLERPVQVESMPALGLLALDAAGAGEARSVSSYRSDGLIHPADGPLSWAFAALMLAVLLLLVVQAARGQDRRQLVLASLAAVLAFASLGKVLSPQFVIWVLPLGALALAWGLYPLAAAVGAAAVVTQLEFPARYFDLVAREPFPIALVALRNLALLASLLLVLLELGRAAQRRLADGLIGSPAPAPSRSTSPDRFRQPRPAPRSATGPRRWSRSGPA
jgi:hypothetical protein